SSGSPVALKLQKEGVGSPELFLDEARTWVSLGSHPHIVRALYASRSDDSAYIVLEMIPSTTSRGCSLRNWLDEQSPIDPELALRWLVQIAAAMQYAVDRTSLIHRDIKPENVLIAPGKDAKVTDFGLAASRVGRGAEGGTPLYMAPEQHLGMSDTRSDIYAVGLVGAEMFLGRLPNLDQMTADTLFREFRRSVEGPPSWMADISRILARCLEPIPVGRYQSFSQLGADLDTLTRKHLAVPAARLLAKPTGSAIHFTNQGLALLNLGRRKEGIHLLQKAVARSPDDAIAVSRLHQELTALAPRRAVLFRYIVNQLSENSMTFAWWIKVALFAGLLAIAMAYSPASAHAKIAAGAIMALLLAESVVNQQSGLTLREFMRAMLGLCVILYALSWV
ncbi:unnamed protein product, partial [marine sediment metagenome]